MPPVIDIERCTGCGLCAKLCPLQVFDRGRPRTAPTVAYPEECWHCGACVQDCKAHAIRLRPPSPSRHPGGRALFRSRRSES